MDSQHKPCIVAGVKRLSYPRMIATIAWLANTVKLSNRVQMRVGVATKARMVPQPKTQMVIQQTFTGQIHLTQRTQTEQ
jgi:hypothetical protein